MNEYERMAKEFLRNTGTKMSISHITKSTSEWSRSDMTRGWLYRVRIDRNHKSWSFNFSDSLSNYMNNERPTPYDILACIQKYPVDDDVWDFANEFGYEINDKESFKEVSKIHKAVQKEYNNVIRMFGDCLEELQNIA